ELDLPNIETQQKIGKILKSLDDKIELNNRINKNLEEQAMTLFKSWFIDFEPFGGKMPDDWKVGSLLNIADYINGLAMQKFRPKNCEQSLPVLKIKELRQGFCDDNSEKCKADINNYYIVQNGDVIFSWSGSLLVDLWCGGECGLNQHLFKVTSQKFDRWFYYLWTKYHLGNFVFIATDKATTMGHIKRDDLKKSKVIIPAPKDYIKINEIMTPINSAIIQNKIESTRLAALRDTLLPKLMSGEIDVSKVDISTDKLSFVILFHLKFNPPYPFSCKHTPASVIPQLKP
ncbi:MAG: restriction endonuclease subunit S, partial [Deferribacterales bacterium]|nr:restriction endonuclease subunit S [Deferribacterales bacterium]